LNSTANLYAVCKCLDDLAMTIEGPAIIFTDEEILAITMGVEAMLNDMEVTYQRDGLIKRGKSYYDLLTDTLAKLTVCREQFSDRPQETAG
jgi:hypothetical protein